MISLSVPFFFTLYKWDHHRLCCDGHNDKLGRSGRSHPASRSLVQRNYSHTQKKSIDRTLHEIKPGAGHRRTRTPKFNSKSMIYWGGGFQGVFRRWLIPICAANISPTRRIQFIMHFVSKVSKLDAGRWSVVHFRTARAIPGSVNLTDTAKFYPSWKIQQQSHRVWSGFKCYEYIKQTSVPSEMSWLNSQLPFSIDLPVCKL